MEDAFNEDSFTAPVPDRKRGLAGLLQRLRRETPAPFRDSDFESTEGRWSAFDPQPGAAD